jgi:hypothetical protein
MRAIFFQNSRFSFTLPDEVENTMPKVLLAFGAVAVSDFVLVLKVGKTDCNDGAKTGTTCFRLSRIPS